MYMYACLITVVVVVSDHVSTCLCHLICCMTVSISIFFISCKHNFFDLFRLVLLCLVCSRYAYLLRFLLPSLSAF